MQFSSIFSVNNEDLLLTKQALASINLKKLVWRQVGLYADLDNCEKTWQHFKHFKHLLVLGIGGSALGTISVIQALNQTDKITVCDYLDPELLSRQIKDLNWQETAICIISKSGETIETMLQMALIEKILQQQIDKFSDRIICITGANSALHQYAESQKYKTIFIPKDIGGRFSIFTPVGIFPLLFAGVDVKNLIAGAESVSTQDLSVNDYLINLTTYQYIAYQKQQRSILVLMTYQKKLMGLLDWYRQLIAESLGKNLATGITPVLAFGSTDQHSQIQLYTEGPQDKLVSFLDAPYENSNYHQFLSENLSVLGIPKPISVINTQKALEQGTKTNLQLHHCPFLTINFPQLNAWYIGQYFMTYMLQITAIAELMKINAFDQPGVEAGKKATIEQLCHQNLGLDQI